MRTLRRANGFSFIEILISIILVGLSITALVFASNSFTMANGAGADLSTAEFLVEQIRELTTLLPVVDPETTTTTFGAETGETTIAAYDDIDDFNDVTCSPPIDANRNAVTALAAFSQTVTVKNVSQSNFNVVVGPHASNFVRITVGVSLNGRELCSASWIRANY
jgi:type II secretory pathway pseudopilin PulG